MLKLGILEDEPLIAFHLKTLLTQLGHEVLFTAPNPEKGFEFLKTNQPDLMLLDIQLQSSLNGIQFAELINKDRSLPFIFISAHADPQTLSSALSVKPLGYIFKPFSKNEIFTTLEIVRQQLPAVNNPVENTIELPGVIGNLQIQVDKLTHVRADKNYIEIYHSDGRVFRKKQTLSGFLADVPIVDFIQIHKSFAANLKFVDEFSRDTLRIKQCFLPIGRSFAEQVSIALTLRKSKGFH
jgi:DNA-binding LytR/AlgR family response regulator